MDEKQILEKAKQLYPLQGKKMTQVPSHEGGRNTIFIVTADDGKKTVLRISALPDRTEDDYLAETDFVHFLAQNGAPVADMIPSNARRSVERIEQDGQDVFLCMFEYAKGMLISDNGYRYREGAPLEEYFFNTGKTLGAIHRLSKRYVPRYPCRDHRQVYSRAAVDKLIPDRYRTLKEAIFERLERFEELPVDPDGFGLIHFDFSDGNYHIDMETGRITVFDFDNCMNCWYMFDLANLWTHGEGWFRHVQDADERRACMERYFDTILEGYRTETDVSDEMTAKLPLFIDMVLIENIVDEFECSARAGERMEDEEIRQMTEWLTGSPGQNK